MRTEITFEVHCQWNGTEEEAEVDKAEEEARRGVEILIDRLRSSYPTITFELVF